jgi:hypothetical protein
MIILFIIIVSVLLIPRSPKSHIENFRSLSGFTSETEYRDLKNIAKFDSRINELSFQDLADDRNYELKMKRCYQFPNYTIDKFIQEFKSPKLKSFMKCVYNDFTVITSDFKDVKNKIVLELQSVHDIKIQGPIHGPVYVMIFQVPYYKNSQNQDISLQAFNTSEYNYRPIYNQNSTSLDIKILYHVVMYYGKYENDPSNNVYRLGSIDNFQPWMAMFDDRNASFEPQCFIQGGGVTEGPMVYGGCASSNGTISGSTTSTCLGPENPVKYNDNDGKKTKSTYAILYTINQEADSLKRYFLNKDSMTYPSSWQYLKDINVPIRMNENKDIECLSNNMRGCLWNQNIKTPAANDVNALWQPLSCGDPHKKIYGTTGYENPNHWCLKSKNILSS